MRISKLFAILLMLCLLAGPLTIPASAAWAPPATIGAPTSLSALFGMDEAPGTRFWFEIGYSASDEVRAFVDAIEEDGIFSEAGYDSPAVAIQIDYKLDDGAWHYTAAWDERDTPNDLDQGASFSKGTYSAVANLAESAMGDVFPDEVLPGGASYFDTHTLHFRMRYVLDWYHPELDGGQVISPWSETVSYNNGTTREDPTKLINHAPVLKSVALDVDSDGAPVMVFNTAPAHADLQQLNADSNERLFTNVWVKIGSGNWQDAGTYMFFIEQFSVAASEFFPDQTDVAAAVYEVKCRYTVDMSYYPGSSSSEVLYSPFSNVIRQGTPAYSKASGWAMAEIDEAVAADLIPDILQGADMTQPITREEFAALAVRLYEKTSGNMAVPVSPNPFKDTVNPEILKAVSTGITSGTGDGTTFSPNVPINREQCATMLFRTIKALRPDADYNVAGVPDFPDQKSISSWALDGARYMAKIGIIKGNAEGYFMPKSDPTVSVAVNYGMATREAAILMTSRSFKQMK